MYLHNPRPKRCAYRFTDRSHRRDRDLSTATCDCFRWSCFMTTLEAGHEHWLKHIDSFDNNINSNPTPNEMEISQ